MADTREYTGYPAGGSLRLSGTVLLSSAEFQALLKRMGEQKTAPHAAHRAAGAHTQYRGLWD